MVFNHRPIRQRGPGSHHGAAGSALLIAGGVLGLVLILALQWFGMTRPDNHEIAAPEGAVAWSAAYPAPGPAHPAHTGDCATCHHGSSYRESDGPGHHASGDRECLRATPHEVGSAVRAPNPWFFAERAYPSGRIPPRALVRARAQAEALAEHRFMTRGPSAKPSQTGSGASTGASSAPAWIPRGPTNIGGRITDLAVHPQNGDIVYAGAAEGGVFRTGDGGATWTPLFDDQPAIAIGALAIDPSDPDTIYAGTGEVNPGGGSVAYGGTGIYRSTDQGQTWTGLGLEQTGAIGRICVDPKDPDRIFVAAMGQLFEDNPERGVYRTTDGGLTWQRVLHVNDTTGCVDLIQRPDQPDVLLAAMWQRVRRAEYYDYGGPACAVYRTTDGGDTWSLVGGGLPAPNGNDGRIGLSLCASQPDVMHAIYADRTGYFDGLYKSVNGGTTWTRTQDSGLSGVFSSYGWWFGNVRTHPIDPNTIFVLGLDFYRSTNGGSSYSNASGSMHVDHHGLAFGPGVNPVIYNGNDGGVYRSVNGGTSWTKRNGLPITQIYRVALDAGNPNALYLGAQDNGTNRTLTGQLGDWSSIYGGDGFQPLVHPLSSNRIWAQYQYGALVYSSNGGYSFSSAQSGISGSDRKGWNCPLVQDPVNPDRRYFGTNRLYRSVSSTSWTAVSPDLTGGPHQGKSGQVNGTITTISVSLLDNGVLWTGSDDGEIHVSTNDGGSWTDVSAQLPDRWVTSVRADPFLREGAYATFSGYRWAEPLPRVFHTEDLGVTWTAIHGDLPDAPVNEILPDPLIPGRAFAATDVGVFETFDRGVTWRPAGMGLPNVVVTCLALREDTRELLAGTYGRSFFGLAVDEGLGAIVPYGAGLAGTGGHIPVLSGQGAPAYGGTFSLDLSGGLGGTTGFLYAGLTPSNLPLLGGNLLVFPLQVAVPVVLDGAAGAPGQGGFSLPATTYVEGVSLYLQVLLLDGGAVKGVSMSNGLELIFP